MNINISKEYPVVAVILIVLTGLCFSATAQAANWFKLRGTEPGGTAHTLQVWGFLQPTYTKDYSDDIEGGVGGFGNAVNGTLPIPGTIPPDRTSQESFYMRRARIGIRGTMIPINNDIDYFILTEWGQNGVTRNGGAAHLLDASVTLNHLSRGQDDKGLHNLGARFRVGQFLFSHTSEALSNSTPGRRVHIYMPEATFQNALRRMASDNGRINWPEDEVAVNAARDIGIEIFDFAEFASKKGGPWEFTYSAALGNGNTIGEQNRDENFRTYYWLSIAKLFDKTRGPRRHSAKIYGWYQKGDIEFNPDIDNNGQLDGTPIPAGGDLNPGNLTVGPVSPGNRVLKNGNERDIEQKYWGIGFDYFDKPFEKLGQIRFNAEYQKQEGLTFDGPQSPSVAVNNAVGGFQSVLYDLDGENEGWYVDMGYDINRHLRLKKRTTINLRYDEFDRNSGNSGREANWEIWTLSGEYFFHKKARVTVTYQWRDASANERNGNAKTNGNAVLDAVDQRLGIQLTFIYKNVLLR
ncbi:MAG: hypothetical protein V3R51_04175 [Gammaproteobacteria bacterium]